MGIPRVRVRVGRSQLAKFGSCPCACLSRAALRLGKLPPCVGPVRGMATFVAAHPPALCARTVSVGGCFECAVCGPAELAFCVRPRGLSGLRPHCYIRAPERETPLPQAFYPRYRLPPTALASRIRSLTVACATAAQGHCQSAAGVYSYIQNTIKPYCV